MSQHSVYPPVIQTTHRRHPVLRAILGALIGVAMLAVIVLGTSAAIAKIESINVTADAAFLQGMAAGVKTCGSRP